MKKKILISLVLIIVCSSMTLYSFAASVTDLQNQKEEAENQKEELEAQQDEVQEQKSEAMQKVEELDSQILNSESQLDNLNAKVEELENSIAQKEKELEEAEAKQKEQEETLEKRIIAQYKTGKVSYWSVLLNPSSFLDFFSNLHTFEKIAKHDEKLIESLKQEKEKIQKTKDELAAQKSEVKTAKAEAEKENVKLKNAKAIKNSEVAKLSDEEKAIQQKIDEFNAAIAEAETEIQKALANSNVKEYQGSFSGTLSWPLSTSSYGYNIITSGYGKRDQPTAGASTNHKALDIGVRYQPVYAPADGYVVTAQKVSGYGNFIMIKHSNNLYTCYGHLSSFEVSVGQSVKRGEVIAISGNTGVSTGPHLHFEVRLNGTSSSKVNPLNYISDSVYSQLIFR